MTLEWEHAFSDEPKDQNAESERLHPDATSAYYSLGPDTDGWSVVLVQTQYGEEIEVVRLGNIWPTEQAAKDAAQRNEDGAL